VIYAVRIHNVAGDRSRRVAGIGGRALAATRAPAVDTKLSEVAARSSHIGVLHTARIKIESLDRPAWVDVIGRRLDGVRGIHGDIRTAYGEQESVDEVGRIEVDSRESVVEAEPYSESINAARWVDRAVNLPLPVSRKPWLIPFESV
jgi:hypothetical protein